MVMIIPSTLSLFLLACLPLEAVSDAQSDSGHRIVQAETPEEEGSRTDLVRLIPFDFQVALLEGDVNAYALTDIITDWMTESFATKSVSEGLLNNQTVFDSIALELVDQSLQTETTAGEGLALFTASLEGVSLWERYGSLTPPMDPELVELIQRATFLDDNTLLQLLQAADEGAGLGDNVVDVRVFVTNDEDAADAEDGSSEEASSTNQNLELIIIIAIAVACVAFALLVFAVVWAWRSDRRASSSAAGGKRKSSTGGGAPSKGQQPPKKAVPNTDGTGSESDFGDNVAGAARASAAKNGGKGNNSNKKNQRGSTRGSVSANKNPPSEKAPPVDIQSPIDHQYPESVISEDISTSLTAYYRSGMSGYNVSSAVRASGRDGGGGGDLNDAASMSSMDSYGYSLDGYAPSLGPAQGGYPVGPLMAARDAPMHVGDDDDVGLEGEEPEDYEAEPHTTL
jgi:hypothetical protein